MTETTMYECLSCGNKFEVQTDTINNEWDEYSDCPACGKRHHHPPKGE